jgi:hypothetical protein
MMIKPTSATVRQKLTTLCVLTVSTTPISAIAPKIQGLALDDHRTCPRRRSIKARAA